jgi:hypothetical protein
VRVNQVVDDRFGLLYVGGRFRHGCRGTRR